MTLSENELDVLLEIINIGVGRASKSLSEMTGSRIELSVPNIEVIGRNGFVEMSEKLESTLDQSVLQSFQGDFSGRAVLGFPTRQAFDLARIVGGIEVTDVEMDDELFGVLEEIGNIFLNNVVGSIANMLDCKLSYMLPELCSQKFFKGLLKPGQPEKQSLALIADTSFSISENDISGSLILFFETNNLKELLFKASNPSGIVHTIQK